MHNRNRVQVEYVCGMEKREQSEGGKRFILIRKKLYMAGTSL